MTQIKVFTKGKILVVDSRLIAEKLEIEHMTLLETIEKYQTQTEQAFGILRFETEKKNKRGRPKKYALLTEDQATFIMTLSRNTDAVIQCKIELVKAFSTAKKLLAVPWQEARLESKATRRKFTDAIKDYLERHFDELSANDKEWLYAKASTEVSRVVFGREPQKLANDLAVPSKSLRDSLTAEELQLVREVENTAMRMIDQLDVHPRDAVAQCAIRLLIPIQTRKATGQLSGNSEE